MAPYRIDEFPDFSLWIHPSSVYGICFVLLSSDIGYINSTAPLKSSSVKLINER